MNYKWTAEDKDFLRQNYNTMSAEEIAIRLNKTRGAVFQKAHKLHIRKTDMNYCRIMLTQEQEVFFRKNYPHVANEVLASVFSCHPLTIRRMARRRGLVKSIEFMRETKVHAAKKSALVRKKIA